MKGRVIKSTGSWYQVHTDQGILSARLKGTFKQDELKLTNPIAVGDWVELEKEEGQELQILILIKLE
jgi:ribosome biogenesis GTPase